MMGGGLLSYLLITAFITVILLTIYLFTSRHFHWFDKPNEQRKIHSQAKPTSAGLVFMLPVVLFLLFVPDFMPNYAFSIGILLMVLVIMGGIDDFKPISVKIRLLAIVIIGCYLLYLFFNDKTVGYSVLFIYLLGIIWWLNLYNFMDGADGMAVLQGIVSIIGYIIIFYVSNINSVVFSIPYMLLFLLCLLAFLLFNFPSAKMFMGDSGSLSVALFLAVFALYGISINLFDEILVISFHLVFIVDATLTLFTRLKFKHSLSSAHNLHYYQALIHSGKSHALVSSLYFLISVLIVGISVYLHLSGVGLTVRLTVLLFEILFLSYFWYNFHNKTKFKRFI